jgi:hypothetical protein
MKRIVVATDAMDISRGLLDFSCYIARLTHSTLTALFMEKLINEELPALKMIYGTPYIETIVAEDIPDNKTRMKQYEDNIRSFRESCTAREVNCTVQRYTGKPADRLIAASRFADLIILDGQFLYENNDDHFAADAVKEALVAAECPVIIAPSAFEDIEEILFAYDGERSSVFAMKLFAYLFPEFRDKKITVMQVNEKAGMPVIKKEEIAEWLNNYYSNISFQSLQGKADCELSKYLLNRKKVLAVTGASGHGIFSGIFRHSAVHLFINTVDCPVFIAHP